MAKNDHVMIRRARAAQATLNRFKGRPFKWGAADCGQLVRFHAIAIGRPIANAAKSGTYHSIVGAQKALKRVGHATMGELMDANFERIPPAAAIVGDIIELPTEGGHPLGALTIALGNGRVLGYHPDATGAAVLQPTMFVAAWRVL